MIDSQMVTNNIKHPLISFNKQLIRYYKAQRVDAVDQILRKHMQHYVT